jgi:hypothetical protein
MNYISMSFRAKNKPHGQGRVVWSNGATYTGQFLEGKYHGLGVYVWPSAKKFVGRWVNGVKNGHGLYTWPNGKKYDGEYKGGWKDGYGRMTWPDGQNYCGGFKKNKRCGRGVQTGPDGNIIHCGQWKSDCPIDEDNPMPHQEQEASNLPMGVPQNVTVDRSKISMLKPTRGKIGRRAQRAGETSGEGRLDVHSKISEQGSPESRIPERDICSPEMSADSDDESCDLMKYDDESLVKIIAPTRLVV